MQQRQWQQKQQHVGDTPDVALSMCMSRTLGSSCVAGMTTQQNPDQLHLQRWTGGYMVWVWTAVAGCNLLWLQCMQHPSNAHGMVFVSCSCIC